MKNLITLVELSVLTACATPNKEMATDEKQAVWDGNTMVAGGQVELVNLTVFLLLVWV